VYILYGILDLSTQPATHASACACIMFFFFSSRRFSFPLPAQVDLVSGPAVLSAVYIQDSNRAHVDMYCTSPYLRVLGLGLDPAQHNHNTGPETKGKRQNTMEQDLFLNAGEKSRELWKT
jgi:hypothetical protein